MYIENTEHLRGKKIKLYKQKETDRLGKVIHEWERVEGKTVGERNVRQERETEKG